MKQYQAGYFIDDFTKPYARESKEQQYLNQLTKWVSHFQVDTKTKFEEKAVDLSSSSAVLINIIQRGLPTKLNLFALNNIVECSEYLEFDNDNKFEIKLKPNANNDIDLIFKALHLTDPRLKRINYIESWEKLGSEYEENFLYNSLPISLGKAINQNGDFIIQLLATQRKIVNIITPSVKAGISNEKVATNFKQQRTDFSIEFPYNSKNDTKGIVVEIDGKQHENLDQVYLDVERDKVVVISGWNNTLRIETKEFNNATFDQTIKTRFVDNVTNNYLIACFQNYNAPLWNNAKKYLIAQLTLIPFAIARIQRMLIEAIAHNRLNISQDSWKIAVLERDVPCAKLAFEDLNELIRNLNGISPNPLILPAIELFIFNTKEFENSDFQKAETRLISDFDSTEFYDLIIDIAVLERSSNPPIIYSNATEIISIRSIHYIDSQRVVASADLIEYYPICIRNDDDTWIEKEVFKPHVEYLLQSLFRKKEFRHGQLPIMHNALQCKSVIGLLPTGGGKSLTYQLSAILQPGICFVVDPIKSLMKDQVDGLLKNHIDSCIYINSTLQGEAKRNAIEHFKNGYSQFVFVSPERLQMGEFRLVLEDLAKNKIYFSYCVIDEAHCVSEWGHDFRTAYLRLGENAMKFCKTKNLETIPLFGLTATASYDVLADVQRELSGNNERKRLTEESIVRAEYTQRDELQFVVEQIDFPTSNIVDIWDLKERIGKKKQQLINELINEIPKQILKFSNEPTLIFKNEDWNNQDDEIRQKKRNSFEQLKIDNYVEDDLYINNGALIFCPHKVGWTGVTDQFKVDRNGNPVFPRKGVYDNIFGKNISKSFFIGGIDELADSVDIEKEILSNQDGFINNNFNLMVATKAFGMGIDKENIRYTIHMNYPSSIESFVQEAGRAGRDRKLAISYILFNNDEVLLNKTNTKTNHDLDINMYFHNNSFKGVSKEMAILDELLTEIYFPDRTFELENQIEIKLGEEVNVDFVEFSDSGFKGLFFNQGFKEKLGFMNLGNLLCKDKDTINPQLSNSVFQVVKSYINSQNINGSVASWIMQSDKEIGIEKMMRKLNIGDSFEIVVGFNNNAKERAKTLANWLHNNIHEYFDETKVKTIKRSASDFMAFASEICNQYVVFTRGTNLDLISKCKQIDRNQGHESGYSYSYLVDLFNGYRDKQDTEKAIYRLSTVGIIDDYTVDFSKKTFTLYGTKKDVNDYAKYLRNYLLKYYSEKTTSQKFNTINSINEPTTIRKILRFLVEFAYTEVEAKRKQGIKDMISACELGVEKGNIELKEFIDLYFNSKYARSGYKVNGKDASLYDLLVGENKTDDNIEYIWYFISLMDIDKPSSQIDNYKHLRGASTRLLRVQPNSYTLLFLNAFSLYLLEYKNTRYIKEAESLLLSAFTSIQEQEPNWDDEKLESIFEEFKMLILEKNDFLKSYFDNLIIDSFLLNRYLSVLKKANKILNDVNKKLN